jgi:two-component system, NtrC family, sensor histidine kinase HydH
VTDVTHTLRHEARPDAEEFENLAAMGELSAVLAHELRNPLSSIKGAAQILQHEWGSAQPQNEFLAIILDEVESLSALTTEFLEFARPSHPELGWACWNDLVSHAVDSVQPIAAAVDIQIEFEPAPDLPTVLVDRVQVERAIRNVILNAVQASSRESTVQVFTRWLPCGVAVEITDQGCGVVPEHLPRIFVPFFTTKLTATGLGLPMSRKIVQNHGGDILVRRNDGPGMTFEIHLPAPGEALPG